MVNLTTILLFYNHSLIFLLVFRDYIFLPSTKISTKKCSHYTLFTMKNVNILQKLQRYFIIFKFIKSRTNTFISLNSSFNNSIMIENISYLKILFPHNLFLNLICIIINQFQIVISPIA